MNRRGHLVIGVVLVVGLSAFAALLVDSARSGTDDQAAEQIGELTGGAYEPWVQPIDVPGGKPNAPLLVGVQAGVGLILLVGCLWYWREHRSGA